MFVHETKTELKFQRDANSILVLNSAIHQFARNLASLPERQSVVSLTAGIQKAVRIQWQSLWSGGHGAKPLKLTAFYSMDVLRRQQSAPSQNFANYSVRQKWLK